MKEYAIFVFGKGDELRQGLITLAGLEFAVLKDGLASDSQVLGYGCASPIPVGESDDKSAVKNKPGGSRF